LSETGGKVNPTFSITTLGCKLNQYESECIRQTLVRRDWKFIPFGDDADFYIINTCTVTGRTDARCRNAIRRARRSSPGTTIVVTGCYAETQSELLEGMEETDIVIGNSAKGSIAGILDELAGRSPREASGPVEEYFEIRDFSDHARAFIKIQDGCDASCAYCIIPRARGRSTSLPPERVLSQVKRLEENGTEEIVLTGIHIGRYGIDSGIGHSLAELVEMIIGETENVRIRLSSIEVSEITEHLVRLMAGTWRVAPHLHVPLQSGDDSILRVMNRPYDTSTFRSRIESIRSSCSGICIGTDVIVGFPGEDRDSFNRTYRFLKSFPVDYFHVFSFSRRPGTPADRMEGQVDPDSKKRRSRRLIMLGKAKRREFMRSRTGTREMALVQGKSRQFSRFAKALSGSYCEIMIGCDDSLTGRLVPVDITHFSRGRLYGRIAEGSIPGERGGYHT
jgi:threonylcarbamoyladenosine tRNA methylthiotransferase MtaB